ncbi:protease inhibitor I42 family protein [Catalinimonas sp. 4WD22]|uniref:protease inhibitor I42 family protein n=1 Tax=Catalinimonas locisalis TaxID=3133978 RepID=UPI003100BDB1
MLKIFFFMYVVLTIMINLSFDHSSPVTAPVTFTEADHQKEVEIVNTRIFSIQLPTHIGNGYQWTINEEEFPAIKILGHSMVDEKPLPGGRQLQIFKMQASAQGSHTVKFEFKRPWENEAIRHYELKLQVIE